MTDISTNHIVDWISKLKFRQVNDPIHLPHIWAHSHHFPKISGHFSYLHTKCVANFYCHQLKRSKLLCVCTRVCDHLNAHFLLLIIRRFCLRRIASLSKAWPKHNMKKARRQHCDYYGREHLCSAIGSLKVILNMSCDVIGCFSWVSRSPALMWVRFCLLVLFRRRVRRRVRIEELILWAREQHLMHLFRIVLEPKH